jgi:hypothetical protein
LQRHPALLILLLCLGATRASAQDAPVSPPEPAPADARTLHDRLAYATVHIITPSASGAGWLLEQPTRPLVITNRQLAESVDRRGARVLFYAGPDRTPVEVRASRASLSRRIDLGILSLDADPPATVRPLRPQADTTVVRGDRIVVGGSTSDPFNAALVPFQTTEAVVTGTAAGRDYSPCAADGSCIVLDIPFFAGASGGPAFDSHGQLAGMLWGGPRLGRLATPEATPGTRQNPSLGYLIGARAIADDLTALERNAAAAATAPPTLPSTPPQSASSTVLNAARPRIAACGQSGTVRVTLHVTGATGEVTRIELHGVPFDSPAGRCVRNVVGALRFPRFSRDTFRLVFPYQLGSPSPPR